MRNKIKEAYRDSAIPTFDVEDVEATIQGAKRIVQALPLPKYVRHEGVQFWHMLRYHSAKILIAQILFCSGLIIYALTLVNPMQEDIYLIMLFTGFVCMVTTSSEMIRSQIMGMWEIEKVCKISPQRILIYKSLTFGTISMILIFLSSVIFTNMYHFPVQTMMLFGFLPFLLITAIILQFSMHFASREAIMCAYVVSASLLVFGGVFVLNMIQENLVVLSLISMIVCLLTYLQYYRNYDGQFDHCLD